nr:efflux RND transporter periplasmic adaptor subunit [uncultured Cohaesibacter sp.]
MTRNDQPSEPIKLSFEDEPGSSRSKWLAVIFSLILVAWMGSRFFLPERQDEEASSQVAKIVSVAVQSSQAQQVTKTFTAEGQAQPDRKASVRAQASGEVIELKAEKGDTLEANQDIAILATRELDAKVLEAQEELSQTQEDFDVAQSLFDKGVATAARLREARATLATSKAQLTQAEEALKAAIIRAPFAGRLDTLDLDIGSYVLIGTEIGVILDTNPLKIIIQVPQQSLAQIKEGQTATVKFITGEERQGTIAYVSRDADSETRTFRAEIIVANPDGAIPSGLSVQVRIPTEQVEAHFISPAILSLSEDGRLGLKAMDVENKVIFYEVVVERAQQDGVWVSGLPESVDLITIGQGFVAEGETVSPIPDDGSLASTKETASQGNELENQ